MMDLLGNQDVCFTLLQMCDLASVRELSLVLLGSRRHRNYGCQTTWWDELTKLHFGCIRHSQPFGEFRIVPQVFANPQWKESFILEIDEISSTCREFLETTLEHSIFESLHILTGDIGHITTIDETPIDCIIFPTNSSLVNFGIGAAGAVFNRAGPHLLELVRSESFRSIRRRTTDAVLTPGFNSGVDHLIHCVGPSPHRPDCEFKLYQTYINAFECARRVDAKCVALVSISTGSLGFPVETATRIAMRAYRDYVKTFRWESKIGIVCYDEDVFTLMKNQQRDILDHFNVGYLTVVPGDTIQMVEELQSIQHVNHTH